jgi:hypothetical protein
MIIDNSALRSFSQCYVKGALRYWLHRRPLAERLATVIGQGTHACFASLLRGDNITDTLDRYTQHLYDLAVAQSLDAEAGPNAVSLLHGCVNALLEGIKFTSDHKWLTVTNSTLHIEYPEIGFQLPLGDSNHTLTGRMDAVVRDASNTLWIIELKTSRKASSITWRQQWYLDTQPKTYIWAAQQQTLHPVAGVIIIPINTAPKVPRLEPQIYIQPPPAAIDAWLDDTIRFCNLLEAIEGQAKYKSDTDTVNISHITPTGRYAGNCSNDAFGKCPSYSICATGYSKSVIESTTVYHEWNPLAEEQL